MYFFKELLQLKQKTSFLTTDIMELNANSAVGMSE